MAESASNKLISDYDFELVSPGCSPGADRWSAKVTLSNDIEPVLPFLNAKLEKANYDSGAKVLVWKHDGHSYAFRPWEIKAAPARDREEAMQLVTEAVDLVNDTWVMRDQIEPDYRKRSAPDLARIYRLLPRGNCGKCGLATCMAFAAALREDKLELTACPLLEEPDYCENRRDLAELFGVPAF